MGKEDLEGNLPPPPSQRIPDITDISPLGGEVGSVNRVGLPGLGLEVVRPLGPLCATPLVGHNSGTREGETSPTTMPQDWFQTTLYTRLLVNATKLMKKASILR